MDTTTTSGHKAEKKEGDVNFFSRLSRRNQIVLVLLVVGAVLTVIGLPSANSTLDELYKTANNAEPAFVASVQDAVPTVEALKAYLDDSGLTGRSIDQFNTHYPTWETTWQLAVNPETENPNAPDVLSKIGSLRTDVNNLIRGTNAMPELVDSEEFNGLVSSFYLAVHNVATAAVNWNTAVDSYNGYRDTLFSPWLAVRLAGESRESLTDPASRTLSTRNLILTEAQLAELGAQ